MDYLFAPDEFSTDEFILRSFMPGDGRLFADARNSSFERHRKFMRWEDRILSDEECEKSIRFRRARYLTAEEFSIGVFSSDGKMLLGETGFHLRMGHGLLVQTAFINMWIRVSHTGRGLGTSVLKAMIFWGFSEWPWDRLTWMCDERNVGSRRVAEKAGMQPEGILRSFLWYKDGPKQNLICHGILREEFREGQPKLTSV